MCIGVEAESGADADAETRGASPGCADVSGLGILTLRTPTPASTLSLIPDANTGTPVSAHTDSGCKRIPAPAPAFTSALTFVCGSSSDSASTSITVVSSSSRLLVTVATGIGTATLTVVKPELVLVPGARVGAAVDARPLGADMSTGRGFVWVRLGVPGNVLMLGLQTDGLVDTGAARGICGD